ncbi:hypothetical protein [Microbispora sp. NPDC049125]|uniref:hypothetical protein n=1 Tax=Microbispora sp. NPDC049125 TaxID=3154929 RepID=UPI003467CD38
MDSLAIETEGRDDKGRLHGSAAVARLLKYSPPGPNWNAGFPVNPWEMADVAVEAADDETVRAALRRLLALHMFALQEDHPMVAMRNLELGDLVQLHGLNYVIDDISDKTRPTITIQVHLSHLPGHSDCFANDRDVEIPLIARLPKG